MSLGTVFRDPWLYAALVAALPVYLGLHLLGVGSGPTPALAAVLMVVVVYPVLEEWCFRGLIQPWLLHRTAGRCWGPVTLANVITSALFAAAHLLRLEPLVAAWLVFPSLVFGALRDRHGRLTGALVTHSAYNLGFVVLFGFQ